MSATVFMPPGYGGGLNDTARTSSSATSVISSSTDVDTDDDGSNSTTTETRISSFERIADARSRFSHTKALFQQLERCASDHLPSFYSPRLQRSATVPAQQAAAAATAALQQQHQKAVPVVPPKPTAKTIKDTAIPETKIDGSVALTTSGTKAANAATPGSPLTQVARNFTQLASDLELLANSPRGHNGSQSAKSTAALSPQKSNRFSADSIVHIREVVTNNDFEEIAKRFSKPDYFKTNSASNKNLAPSSQMDGAQPTKNDESPNGAMNGGGAGESYDAYWRDAAFYKRRLVGAKADKDDKLKEHLTALDQENEDEDEDELGMKSESSGESIPSEPRPSTTQSQNANSSERTDLGDSIASVASSTSPHHHHQQQAQNYQNHRQALPSFNPQIGAQVRAFPQPQQHSKSLNESSNLNTDRSYVAKKTILSDADIGSVAVSQPSFALLRRSHTQHQPQAEQQTNTKFNSQQQHSSTFAHFRRQTSNPNIRMPSPQSANFQTKALSDDDDLESPCSAPAVPSTEPPANETVPAGAVRRAIETWRGLSPERDALNRKVSFSTAPIKVFKTHGVDEYDRRNDEIDPVASCAEYELERRLDRMKLFDVQLTKGAEGLGVSIIGMGVGADAGLEKLGIFVKSITPGGAVHRDGRIRVCDQIVSVDGISLVGVSQIFAAQTLRATTDRVTFTIGREANLGESEVAQLIQQSLEQDRLKLLAQSPQRQDHSQPLSSTANDQHLQNSAVNRRQFNEPPSVPKMSNLAEEKREAMSGTTNCQNAAKDPSSANLNAITNANAAASGWSEEEAQIRSRICALESDLDGSHCVAKQMRDVLENTRTHYTQLENKYDEARVLLHNYQEREKALLEREETHVKRLREKDAQYGNLVEQLRGRIDELEARLEAMARQRASVVDGELSVLRERLAACSASKQQEALAANAAASNGEKAAQNEPNETQAAKNVPNVQKRVARSQKHTQNSDAENDAPTQVEPPPLPQHRSTPTANTVRAAGLSQRALSAAPPPHLLSQQQQPYEHFVFNGVQLSGAHIYATSSSYFDDPIYAMSAARQFDPFMGSFVVPANAASVGCESPVPRVSEPASPAMPPKFAASANGGGCYRGLIPPDRYPIPGTPQQHHRNRILFPLRRRYAKGENEFWREDVEAQGLQVLQWSVDEVCQMLIHIGLDKYIPEFTVNEVTGPKFLDLDGNRLKSMGIYNHSDRSIIKKKIKTIKSRIERERKTLERESRARAAANAQKTKSASTKDGAPAAMNGGLMGGAPPPLTMISIRQ